MPCMSVKLAFVGATLMVAVLSLLPATIYRPSMGQV